MAERTNGIIMYGTTWCPDCTRAKRVFARHSVDYQWINIEEAPETVGIVLRINGGNRTVPTILFPDGSFLAEPSDRELETKLGVS